jgi:hypothetical protein
MSESKYNQGFEAGLGLAVALFLLGVVLKKIEKEAEWEE